MHTQQDVIPCPGLMVQPCLDPSLPINDHATYNCTARQACGSRSTLYPPFLPFTLWIMTVLLTGLSRVFVSEYFKGTSGCERTLNEQRPQEVISRKNQGTCSHYKTRTVNTPLPYSIWCYGTSKKSGPGKETPPPPSLPKKNKNKNRRMLLDYKLVPDRSQEYKYNLNY